MSQAQDEWLAICQAVRAGLAEQAKTVASMPMEAVALLVDAIDTAMWSEMKAATHDQGIEARKAEMDRDTRGWS